MAHEEVFFNDGGVFVSDKRVVAPNGDTYSLVNITSCKTRYELREGTDKKKSKINSLLFWGGIILGIVVAYFVGFWYGVAIAAAGIIANFLIDSTFEYKDHCIILGSASGDNPTIWSEDEGFILAIRDAINSAISFRS